MKKLLLFFVWSFLWIAPSVAQTDTVARLIKKTYMIPMRDGIKLFTILYLPANYSKPVPFLIERTPYGTDNPLPVDSSISVNNIGYYHRSMLKEGYIMVFQDIRGKFKSEGSFEMCRPLYHLRDKTKTDESTDAYDTIDWLVKNIKNNNGKAGILGISYPGYMALQAVVDAHPALKASSPQASPADMWLGDDFHHNGAFRLGYAFEYSYLVENAKEGNSNFPFTHFDTYDWYLKLGPLKNVNEKHFKNRLPSWNDFAAHPHYDAYWQNQSSLNNIFETTIPTLHVGGYYDQEDLNGPQAMYTHLEKKDKNNLNYLVLGPWHHGQWARDVADSLGKIAFESNSAGWFHALQKRWFDYWLKGIGDGKFEEAYTFQTGSNAWKQYNSWPPKNAAIQQLYPHADGRLQFTKPTQSTGAVAYVSDPAKPVPYRNRPIEATFSEGSGWYKWHVDDQRFADARPDVLSFTADSLTADLTVAGKIKAHIFASTSAGDADFVVKLIDVYPDMDNKSTTMSGYQLPVAMEVFRARYRKSFEKPEPMVANQPTEIVIDLHDINHTFLKGHKLMLQIQSSWFPIIDRNPQKYVPNIFEARESDFIKATHTIYCNSKNASYIELPVLKD